MKRTLSTPNGWILKFVWVGITPVSKTTAVKYLLVTAPAVVSSFVSLNTFPQNRCNPAVPAVSSIVM